LGRSSCGTTWRSGVTPTRRSGFIARPLRQGTGVAGELLTLTEVREALVVRAVLDNLMRFILPAVAGPARLVPLEALATADLSVIALRNAAERGRLRAVRTPDGTWQSSKQWVTVCNASRYKALKAPRQRRRMDAVGS